ncbi:SRPBCC family protein [Streptomyces clavuligerus]|uniref:Activator of HSP90 ATPase 1 family protein n=1 Tax=Streptomyces clavuligerus TaxID=1901 RepID=B5GVG8_STRCL|nr:SRPBCC family protein [Streptomyces clavuligerus]ANW17950.1 ATPase [Streptomyces clavuligerus]AXU12510.1 ATPase [Streptomyces clavuligerus]EDY50314.1 conserved hypothetical protein [Streptomyces clavuligerus]EFG09483.1 Activator of HSP90 ATPase 1 family protein [Streptomyces clavuligerus]MBY6302405.1 SRPBCC domain-containing protein [Streptomyces clavuligerus]
MDAHPDAIAPAGAGRTALRLERRVDEPPARVWAALTEPELLARWFPARVALEPRAGGTIGFLVSGASGGSAGESADGPRGEEEPTSTGTVTAWDEPRLFAFTWGEDELRWETAPDGDGTLLTLTHTFGDPWGAASFASGWHLCLTALSQLLAGQEITAGRDSAGTLHEEYVHRLGLDRGTVEPTGDGGRRIRYERQLVRPATTVWDELTGPTTPLLSGPVPPGFTVPGARPGRITELRPPRLLAYEPPSGGEVRWRLQEGTGHGARLILTATVPGEAEDTAEATLESWRTRIERLAAELTRR